jgi:hypothetical protein
MSAQPWDRDEAREAAWRGRRRQRGLRLRVAMWSVLILAAAAFVWRVWPDPAPAQTKAIAHKTLVRTPLICTKYATRELLRSTGGVKGCLRIVARYGKRGGIDYPFFNEGEGELDDQALALVAREQHGGVLVIVEPDPVYGGGGGPVATEAFVHEDGAWRIAQVRWHGGAMGPHPTDEQISLTAP